MKQIITWDDFRSGSNADIYAQKLDASGIRQWRGLDNFFSGRIISIAAANQRGAKICTDGSTGAIIAWQDFRNGSVNSTDIYAQRIDNSGLVKWAANGVALSTKITVQAIQNIAFTGDGAAVGWLDYPTTGSFTDYDMWAQKVDTAGLVAWGDSGITVCNAPDLQNLMQIAGDGSGGLSLPGLTEEMELYQTSRFMHNVLLQTVLLHGQLMV